mmetsp:Transcript_19988/g.26997  ORF Transcript_19988/g.26997 Transcript_19988/m.26997 type:complete len:153 (+) Transcript_19988:193-651(+)
MRHSHRDVLVEEIQDEGRNARIACPSVDEDQSPELLKFGNCKVGGLDSTHTLIAKKTDAHVRLIDHGNIIVSVANRHSNQTFVMHFNHADDVCLLLWRDTTADDSLASLTNSNEVASVPIIVTDEGERLILNNDRSTLLLPHQLLVLLDAFA